MSAINEFVWSSGTVAELTTGKHAEKGNNVWVDWMKRVLPRGASVCKVEGINHVEYAEHVEHYTIYMFYTV